MLAALVLLALVAASVPNQPIHAAIIMVDTPSDDPNDGLTLREAITTANSDAVADIITFDASFNTSQTITLFSALPGHHHRPHHRTSPSPAPARTS